MADLVDAVPLGQLGVSGATIILLALVVRSIIKGDLVPRQVLDDTKSDRDHYRKAFERERDGHDESRRQVTRLLESGRVYDHSWESIREKAEEASDGTP